MIAICVICRQPIESLDGLSYFCEDCGRGDFCDRCAAVGNHDCDPMIKIVCSGWPFWVADPDSPAADPDDWETERGEGEGLLLD